MNANAFNTATQSENFSTHHAITEARVFFMLGLDQPLLKGKYTEHHLFLCKNTSYLCGDMIPRIVLEAENFNLETDFMYEDVHKCVNLLHLIHLKAGEPDSELTKMQRDVLYTDAYCWIIQQTDTDVVGYERGTEFTNFLLEYTGFESIQTMREFINVIYIPVEFVTEKTLPRDKEFGLGILINNGLYTDSHDVIKFVTKELAYHQSNLRKACRDDDTINVQESLIMIRRLMKDFAPEESSRPSSSSCLTLPAFNPN